MNLFGMSYVLFILKWAAGKGFCRPQTGYYAEIWLYKTCVWTFVETFSKHYEM